MANVFTHQVGVTYHTDAGTVTSTTDAYTGDAEVDFIGSFNAGASNSEIDVAVTIANIKSFVMYSDKDVTLKTNSTVPSQTLVLLSKKQLVWNPDHLEANPLTTNVTKIYLSCTDTAVFRCHFLLDQTP